jgi:hypothetical protein
MRIAADHLRPPGLADPTGPAYKDWLHLNVFDHRSGAIAIINASLHGDPADPAARAVGTALLNVPAQGWLGNVYVRGLREAALGDLAIGLDTVGIGVHTATGQVAASVRGADDGLRATITATAVTRAAVLDPPIAFGSGWIGWSALPRLTLAGELAARDQVFDLDASSGYADHNWGRWHWGENIGWEWGAFLTPIPGPEIVFSRVTDRRHSRAGPAWLHVGANGRTRRFGGESVRIDWGERVVPASRRLPGALAALHSDRAGARQPRGVTIVADDGHDRVELEFTTRDVVQVGLGDPMRRGYSFLYEMVGSFGCRTRIGGVRATADGLAVVERVE